MDKRRPDRPVDRQQRYGDGHCRQPGGVCRLVAERRLHRAGPAFDAQTGNKTAFSFAGSQVLRTQLENGAKAAVYASANDAQYIPLVIRGVVAAGQLFARNKLTLTAPKNNPALKTLNDLTRPGLKVVIADKAVPLGDHTCRMLSAINRSGNCDKDFSARTLKNVVSKETNVRQVALKVQLSDAAVVYATDVTPILRPLIRVVALSTRFNQNASDPIGALKSSASPEAAQAFVSYVQSATGQQILRKWGFPGPQ